MESGGHKKVKTDREREEEGAPPFSYRRTFGVGGHKLQEQTDAIIGDDQAVVSSFIDELLNGSVAGREFAKKSLSIRNATRGADEAISTEM